VAAFLDALEVQAALIGLRLNRQKCEVILPPGVECPPCLASIPVHRSADDWTLVGDVRPPSALRAVGAWRLLRPRRGGSRRARCRGGRRGHVGRHGARAAGGAPPRFGGLGLRSQVRHAPVLSSPRRS
jgi:hypothetical protein